MSGFRRRRSTGGLVLARRRIGRGQPGHERERRRAVAARAIAPQTLRDEGFERALRQHRRRPQSFVIIRGVAMRHRARGVAAVEHEHVVVGQVRHGRAQRAKQAGAARRQGLGVTRGHENDRHPARARRVADRVPGVDRSDVGTIVARRPRRRDIRRARRRGRARDERQAPQRGRRGPASHHRPGCSAARFGARTAMEAKGSRLGTDKYLSGAFRVTTRIVEQLCSLADNVTSRRAARCGAL